MFIGYYSLANAVTLFGLISAITSCFLAANGNFKFAIYMMFLSCLCDTIDGRLARLAKKRSTRQKYYGIQLDSLCDLVSFGVTPCFIAFSFGFDGWFDVIIYCFFIACGAIRLAYFNSLATENCINGKKVKDFRGIPIPVSTFLVTILFLFTTFIPASVTVWLFRLCFIVLAVGYVFNIKIKKPNFKQSLIAICAEVLLLLILLITPDCKAPIDNDSQDTEITEETSETENE